MLNLIYKMNKKGFTMIELLMVIAILGLLSLILVPGVIEMSNKNDIKSCQSLEKNIISAARIYVTENKYELGFDCNNTEQVSIGTLIDTGKLKGPVINPKDKSEVSENKNVEVKYNCATKTFDYAFSLGCEEK